MSPKVSQLKSRRIFLALWPNKKVRRQLVSAFRQTPQAGLHGQLFKPDNLHLTLHFLGNISQQQFDCVHKVASEIRLASFDLSLSRYGFFDRARVFWIGPDIIPQALIQLHDDLGRALINCDYHKDWRSFTPHITLMRKLKKPSELAEKATGPEPISWHINQFALVESLPGKDGVDYIPRVFYSLI